MLSNNSFLTGILYIYITFLTFFSHAQHILHEVLLHTVAACLAWATLPRFFIVVRTDRLLLPRRTTYKTVWAIRFSNSTIRASSDTFSVKILSGIHSFFYLNNLSTKSRSSVECSNFIALISLRRGLPTLSILFTFVSFYSFDSFSWPSESLATASETSCNKCSSEILFSRVGRKSFRILLFLKPVEMSWRNVVETNLYQTVNPPL